MHPLAIDTSRMSGLAILVCIGLGLFAAMGVLFLVFAAMYGFRRENPAPRGHDVMAVLGSPDASLAPPVNDVVEAAGSGI